VRCVSVEVLDLLWGCGGKGRRRSSGRLVGGIDTGHFGSRKRRGWGGVPFNGRGKRLNVVAIQSPIELVTKVHRGGSDGVGQR
jgi:hypothetical protein